MAKLHFTGLFLLVWLAYLFITGLTLFSRGFLLKRNTIILNNTCHTKLTDVVNLKDVLDKTLKKNTVSSCWLPPRFAKSIIIMIDGLRYDFVSFNEASSQPFSNHLSVVHRLLTNQTRRSALAKFVADPPTTTMQRLKGLTTGSLPTFIDAGRNFASSEIEEDNIIDQLVANQKKIVFMGDDTWTNLFPNRFVKSFPYSSFNVKDLHTVDQGIQEHLVPQIKTGDWDVIIAHFLGVDHCGHRYGPSHEAMRDKLREMNAVLESVIAAMDHETVLFVMGDHGMTEDGDHGGDSANELEAALFIHSKSQDLYGQIIPSEIKQVDFPPTFASLLGLPIPFSNLGKVVTEMFVSNSSNVTNKHIADSFYGALASYVNMRQVESYLNEYLKISRDISLSDVRINKLNSWKKELENLTAQLPNLSPISLEFPLQRIIILSTLYVRTVLEMCHQVWAQFDYAAMLGGVFITIIASLVSLSHIVFRRNLKSSVLLMLSILSVCGCFMYIRDTWSSLAILQEHGSIIEVSIFIISIVVYLFGCTNSVTVVNHSIGSQRLSKLSVIIIVSLMLLRFSNSFIVCEDSIVCYFLTALIGYEVVCRRPQEKKKLFESLTKKKWKFEMLSYKRVTAILFVTIIICLIRLSRTLCKCREEQWWCESSYFIQPIAGISTEFVSYRNWRLFFSVCCVMSVVFSSRWLLRKAGNLNGFSPSVLCYIYSSPVVSVLICFSWVLQALTPKASNILFPNYSVIIPNLVFIIAMVNIFVYFLMPLFIYNSVECEVDEIGPFVKRDRTEIVHQVYRHIKTNWKKHLLSTTASSSSANESSKPITKPLIVYGLATLFSAPIICIITFIVFILLMLSRDGVAVAFTLLLLTAALTLHVLVNLNDKNDIAVQNSWIIAWSLLSSVGFFTTGHQTTFPTLHWESALLGSDGNFNTNVLPAIKMLLNTYSSAVIFGISLPILMLWPVTNRILYEKHHLTNDAECEIKRGEFLFYGNPTFFSGLLDLSIKYIWFEGTKMLSSMLAVAIHRRHLMVWKIFAPKFLFEGVEFLVTVVAVILGYVLMLRVYAAVDRWMLIMENKRVGKHI
ncbi:hypothetical protein CHUAL_000629 [Chamberlinius hualienensis]